MAFVARELRPDEWSRLAHTPIGDALPVLPPDSRIVVVEDDRGAIVATWAAIRYVHVEGLWIDPSHRGRGAVGRRLLRCMRDVARSWGARAVLTASLDDAVTQMIYAVGGQRLPGAHYVLPTEGPLCLPRSH